VTVSPLVGLDRALADVKRVRDYQLVIDSEHLINSARAAAMRPTHQAERSRLGTGVKESSPLAAIPSPVSSARCPAGPVKDEIDAVFGPAGPWAESVAWRESNCQPGTRNGSSGSAGIFQLLGHQDLLRAACPTLDPSTSWADPDCNIRAAKYLYDAAGIAPWRL